MRNLKKILALVLALMMTVSLMVVASAASYDDYSDKEQIDETYAVAVEVLAGIGMYQGDTEGTFRPQENLSRAEVATLLYRLTTGDYDGSKVDTYAGYDEFTDVPKDQWYAGYVNYAYVEGYVIGNGDGTFSPENNVTGAELATMLLRVLGRDAEGEEISGDDWALDASVLAAKLGLNENLPSVFMSKDATREQTAQMIFNALQIETYWNWSGNYRPTGDTLIGLKSTRGRDIWGRPGDQWSTNSGNVAFLEDEPVAVYYTAETECDIATDLGAALKAGYKVYTNGENNETADTINPLNRVSTLGEQGRRTEIYANKPAEGTIVYIDTFVAVVDSVTDRTYDVASHTWKPATMTYTISGDGYTNESVQYTVQDYTADYPYSKGDVLSLNKITEGDQYLGSPLSTYPAYNLTELSATMVTVNAITQTANGNAAGFVGTNGVSYLYNYTFAGTKLDTTAIGSTYTVWTDAHGNVLKLAKVSVATAGYGVVTGLDVERIALNKHVVVANVLQADGSTDKVYLTDSTADNGVYYKDEDRADTAANAVGLNTLISYTDKNADGVCEYTKGSTANCTVVECGETNAINSSNLVDDDTVFFIANYTYQNATKTYVFTNYSIVTGFKNIKDLTIDAGTFETGSETQLDIEVLKDGTNANVVLVKNANKQVEPATQDVKNYAFLTTVGDYVDISDDFHTYTKALINGAPGQLQVTNAAAANVTGKGTGLYSYTNHTTNGWDTVVKETANEANKGNWTAPVAGVMELNGAKKTVADDCVIYLVNATTGTCDALSMSVLGQYTVDCGIAVQYDNYGYVDLIYVVDADLT